MEIESKDLNQLLNSFPMPNKAEVDQYLSNMLNRNKHKIVVLDDDPTGVQTIHGISVYTDWSINSIKQGFEEENSMFFILTNSRSFTQEETSKAHREIAQNIAQASELTGKDFIVISRSDSTLRGHYPLETEVLKETLEECADIFIDAEVIIPFFVEGGRYTADNIHYVFDGKMLVPAGQTEFAKDKTFGYSNSHLGMWVEEKSNGKYKADDTVYISLEDIRKCDYEKIKAQLMAANNFGKIIVNAVDYIDVKIFVCALMMAMSEGKKFIFRSAAALTKVIGGVPDKALLTRTELITDDSKNGGLIIVGSHVQKTTKQLEKLISCEYVKAVEFNQHLVLQPEAFKAEIDRVISICEQSIEAGQTTVVFTRRDRLDLNTGDKEAELGIAVKISDALTSIVQRIKVRPAFIIAKGGITSSDIGTKGLGVKKALVGGQIRPGIPVWIIGAESRFPQMPYIIFPGNVGTEDDLKISVDILMGRQEV